MREHEIFEPSSEPDSGRADRSDCSADRCAVGRYPRASDALPVLKSFRGLVGKLDIPTAF